MKKTVKNISVFIPFLLLLMNCDRTKTVFNNETKIDEPGLVRISEIDVEIGQKITAQFFNLPSIKIYDVTFNQKNIAFSQQGDSSVTLIVPWIPGGNGVGNFVFYCRLHAAPSVDTVLVSNQIRYTANDCGTAPCIKWNDHAKITETDSWKYDGFAIRKWSARTSQDTVLLFQSLSCHDECGYVTTLAFLDNGSDVLPTFLYASYDRNECLAEPVHIKIGSRCKIIIHEWNKELVFSGTFTSADYSWIFWCRNLHRI